MDGNDSGGPGESSLPAAVRERLRSRDGTRLNDPPACPDCGERNYRKHSLQDRTFAVLLTGEDDDPEEVTVEYRRFWCKNCEHTVSADRSSLFYEDCRYGKPVVDLCLSLSAGMPPGTVADRIRELGVRVDEETVARYVDLFDTDGTGPAPDDGESVDRIVRRVLFDGDPAAGPDSGHEQGVDDGTDADGSPAADAGTGGDSGVTAASDPSGESNPTDESGSTGESSAIDGSAGVDEQGDGPDGPEDAPDERGEEADEPGDVVDLGDGGDEPPVGDPDPGGDAGPAAPGEEPDGPGESSGAPHGRPADVPAELDLVMRRSDLLELLDDRGEPTSTEAVVDALHRPRSTVNRVVSELDDAGLLDARPEGYVLSQVGRLALARYREFLSEGWSREAAELLSRRLRFVEWLSDPVHKADLVDRLDCSRSTVDRVVGSLSEAGFVERRTRGFVATGEGREAAADFRSLLADLQAVVDARAVLDPLPHDCELPLALVTEARTETGDPRYHLFEDLADQLAGAGRYRAVLPRVVDSRHLRLVHSRTLGEDLRTELVAAPRAVARIRGELPHVARELVAAPGFDLYSGETPPFGLLVAGGSDPGDAPTVVVVTYDDGVAGYAITDAGAAVEWARDRYESVVAAARSAADEWETASVSADLPRLTGDRLLPRLRDQGFVRVDETYFDRQEPMDPTTAWRAGLGLAEVREGYAIGRQSGDRTVADDLVEHLDAGENAAVLGPPGSGKSTVCKRVACWWFESGRGPVLYRESGRGEQFEATGALETVLKRSVDPVLVVVEDAVRTEANAVFEAIETFADHEGVTFLLDARERDWSDPAGPVDARTEAIRHEYVETTRVPALDGDECKRLVDRVEDVIGEAPPFSATDLLAEVRETATRRTEGDGGPTPGEVFLLFHRLSRHLESPVGDGAGIPTSLDEHVDRVRADLADIGDTALDVGVLVNALNASGLAVDPAYAHAVARDPGDHDAVREALSRLDGEVLFEAEDAATYRTIHETWSVAFLARLLDAEGEPVATGRFGRCLTDLLALADDPARREAVAAEVVDTGAVESVATDPGAWVADVVDQLFALGQQRPKLAPLYERDAGRSVDLPGTAPPDTGPRCQVRLGEMLLDGGYYERAERAYRRVPETDEELAVERCLGLAEAAKVQGDSGVAETRVEGCLDRIDRDDRPVLWARAEAALGRIAFDRGEYGAATDRLEAARGCFERHGERRHEAGVLVKLGDIARHRGDLEAARDYHLRSRDIREELGDRKGKAENLLCLGIVSAERGDYGAARSYYRRTRDIAAALGDRHVEGASLGNLGSVAMKRGDFETAREYYRLARDIFEDLGRDGGVAGVLGNLGSAAQRQGDHEAADDHLHRSLELYREIDSPDGEANALMKLGYLAFQRGNYETARDRFQRCLDIDRDLGNRIDTARTRGLLGRVARAEGEYDLAREHLRESRDIAEDVDHPETLSRALLVLGRVACDRGEYDEADGSFRRALDVVDRVGLGPEKAAILAGIARADTLRGDLEVAEEYARRAVETARDGARQSTRWKTRVILARVLSRRGRLAAAAEGLSELLDGAAHGDAVEPLAEARIALGVVQRERGNGDAARSLLTDALEDLDGAGHALGTARCRIELARLARDRGDPETAVDHARGARAVAREAGIPHVEADATVLLGACTRARGEFAAARERIEEGLATARTVGYAGGEATALHESGRMAAARGDLETADRRLAESRALATEGGYRLQEAAAAADLGAVALDRGAADEARELLAGAVEQFREMGAVPRALDALDSLVEACRADGDVEAAATWCDAALDLATESDCDDHDRSTAFDRRRRTLRSRIHDD